MKPITARQEAILRFVREYYRDHHYPPTQREIARAVGLRAVSSVSRNLALLAYQGHLRRAASGARCYYPKEK